MSEIGNKVNIDNLKWIRGLDVLHRPDYFITRIILQTDGERLFFNYVAVNKDGGVMEEKIDEFPITPEELRNEFEQIKEGSQTVLPNT